MKSTLHSFLGRRRSSDHVLHPNPNPQQPSSSGFHSLLLHLIRSSTSDCKHSSSNANARASTKPPVGASSPPPPAAASNYQSFHGSNYSDPPPPIHLSGTHCGALPGPQGTPPPNPCHSYSNFSSAAAMAASNSSSPAKILLHDMATRIARLKPHFAAKAGCLAKIYGAGKRRSLIIGGSSPIQANDAPILVDESTIDDYYYSSTASSSSGSSAISNSSNSSSNNNGSSSSSDKRASSSSTSSASRHRRSRRSMKTKRQGFDMPRCCDVTLNHQYDYRPLMQQEQGTSSSDSSDLSSSDEEPLELDEERGHGGMRYGSPALAIEAMDYLKSARHAYAQDLEEEAVNSAACAAEVSDCHLAEGAGAAPQEINSVGQQHTPNHNATALQTCCAATEEKSNAIKINGAASHSPGHGPAAESSISSSVVQCTIASNDIHTSTRSRRRSSCCSHGQAQQEEEEGIWSECPTISTTSMATDHGNGSNMYGNCDEVPNVDNMYSAAGKEITSSGCGIASRSRQRRTRSFPPPLTCSGSKYSYSYSYGHDSGSSETANTYRNDSSRDGAGFRHCDSSNGTSASSNDAGYYCLRSFRVDGRFVLREVRAPPQKYVRVSRKDGCLKLHLVNVEPRGEDDGGGKGPLEKKNF